jgi:predicted Fe-Mo cluster-binding NifX family protein
MRLALTTYNGRISPLFDCARIVLVVDDEHGEEAMPETSIIEDLSPYEKIKRLQGMSINALICGGIDQHTRMLLEYEGIEVFPWVTGDVDSVLRIASQAMTKLSQKQQEPSLRARVAITGEGPTLNDQVGPRFGRSPYLFVVDENDRHVVLEQPVEQHSGPGGTRAALSLSERDVGVLITGSVSPNAMGILNVARIQVFQVSSMRVIDALRAFRSGMLDVINEMQVPNARH